VKRSDKLFPYVLMTPSLVIIFLVLILPLFFAVYCSVFNAKAMSFDKFVGLDNFIKVLTNDIYRRSLYKTFLISGASLVISLVLGIAFALWTHKYGGFIAFFIQMLVLIPWVTSQVVGAMLWKWLLNEDVGLINYVIGKLGGSRLHFFSNETVAMGMLIFVIAWRTIGYAMVNVLAGLKGIPQAVEEAAIIDGSNRWQKLIYIRLPMVRTPILISTIVIALSNINNLIVPLALTGGGPGTATSVITIQIYRLGFTNLQFGLSSALSLILFAVTIILSIGYVRVMKYDT